MTLLNYPEPIVSDGMIRLCPWDVGDLECVRQAAGDPWIPKGTTVPARYSPEEDAALITRQHRRITTGQGVSLAIARTTTEEPSGEAVGLIILQIRPDTDRVEFEGRLRRFRSVGDRRNDAPVYSRIS